MKKSLFTLALLASAAPALPAFAQTSASPYTSGVRYDALRRVTGTIAPDPDGTGSLHYLATRNSYDAAGRLAKVETGELGDWQSEAVAPASWSGFTILQTVETQYDALDRKVRETARGTGSARTLTEYSYDDFGRLECTAVRMNIAAFGTTPQDACTPRTEGSHGPDRITKNSYDAAGQLLKVTEALGTGVQADTVTNVWLTSGKLSYLTDAEGNRTTYEYDGHDRLVKTRFPVATKGANASSTTDVEQYGYDDNSNRTSLTKRDGSVLGFQYDTLNRMTVKVVPARSGLASTHTRDVFYAYDLLGRQTQARFDSLSGSGIAYAYDNAGRLTSVTDSTGGASRTLTFDYDPNGNRTRITHPDGTFFTYSPDGMDRVTGIAEGTAGTSLAAITYDQLGRRDAMSRAGGESTDYAYDLISRLSSLKHELGGTTYDLTLGFDYNPASQIVANTRTNDAYSFSAFSDGTTSSSVNGLNQLVTSGGASFDHDANGNTIFDGAKTYTYDIENRLVTASNGTTLIYDPMGRLHQVAGATSTTQFLYDGDKLVAGYEGSGNLLKRYVHGSGIDEPLVQYEGAGLTSRRSFYADHQGSIVAASNGSSVSANTYDEYGVPASGNSGRFQYTGQAWLPEIGRYHYKARSYNPYEGRFDQTDPIGYEDQMNLYAYVGNDPVNRTDSTGQAIDVFVDVGLIIADGIDIYNNGLNWTNGVSLGANVVGAVVPGATGLGTGTRALMNGGEAASRVQQLANRSVSRIGARTNVLNRRHYSAAIREARGEVVARRPDGKPFDHINELRESVTGLKNDLRQAQSMLRSGKLGPQDTDRLKQAVRGGQKLLNEANSVLRRVNKCTGTRICP